MSGKVKAVAAKSAAAPKAAAVAAPTPAPTPVAAATPVATPSAAPAKKAAAVKKEEVVVAAPVVAAPVPTPAAVPAVEEKKEETVVSSEERFAEFSKKIASLQETVKTLTSALSTLSKDFVALQKLSSKELKEASKKGGRRGKKNQAANGTTTNRAQSGLTKPTLLSDDLCTFLGVPAKTQLGRSEVAKSIHGYVIKHNLQKAENKKIILPDATMKKLLNIQNGEELSYFNIMHYLKPHFIKTAPVS
jgi:chromatin remodeling complex protein RSC6